MLLKLYIKKVKLSKNKIEERKLIEREIEVHKKLKHPNLIRMYNAAQTPNPKPQTPNPINFVN